MHGRLFKIIPLPNLPNLPPPTPLPASFSSHGALSPPHTLWTRMRGSCWQPWSLLDKLLHFLQAALHPATLGKSSLSGVSTMHDSLFLQHFSRRTQQGLFRCPSLIQTVCPTNTDPVPPPALPPPPQERGSHHVTAEWVWHIWKWAPNEIVIIRYSTWWVEMVRFRRPITFL